MAAGAASPEAASAEDASTEEDRIAVTVLGGYLGAGKTTLLNNLLRSADERIAVLVNDFGEINIDADLIEKQSDDTIELSNGCICCSMVDGFSEALERIAALEPRPARLVIEASGVADPGTVAAYGHGRGLALDAVVVLADAETIRDAADDRYLAQTVRQQLAAGDLVVLNKIDLVDAGAAADTVAWLHDTFPDAAIITATESRVPAEVIFGRSFASRATTGKGAQSDHGEHGHRSHAADAVFRSRVEQLPTPVERDEIERFMADLPDTTVRAKGIVHLVDESAAHELQRVGRRWTLRARPDIDLARAGPVVVIDLVTDRAHVSR